MVVNYSRSKDEAQTTAAELELLGADVRVHKADVSKEHEVKAMIAATVDRYGRLDVLVNNAGTTHFIPHPDLDALTEEVWNDIFSVNVKGTFYCCRAAAPALRKAKGAIVNVASIAGYRGSGSSMVYAISKAGVLQLTRSMAVALAPEVRVNSVSPGLVSSRWFRRRFGEEAADAQETTFAAATPLAAIASPDDVALAIMAFVENDAVTGQDVIVDGGKSVTY